MPTIEFSNDFFQGSSSVISRVVNRSQVSYGNSSSASAPLMQAGYFSPGAMASIQLMKGTVPTDFSTLTGYSARSADQLVRWTNFNESNSGNPTYLYIQVSAYTSPMVWSSVYTAATQSGLATWFWFTTRAITSNGSREGNTIYHQIVGTVGTTGSGADMELPDVNIVSGNNYRFLNLRIGFSGPTYTY